MIAFQAIRRGFESHRPLQKRIMDQDDRLKQEMFRWSSEVRDRYYFEVKINAFLKSEITRLENEVLQLRLENHKLQAKIHEMSIPAPPSSAGNLELEID